MPQAAFLQDLAVVMLAAGLVTVAFRWLRQSAVLGYILAGALIGPHLLPRPLVTNEESIHTLAQLGIVFVLFSLGLQFNLRKLRQLGATGFVVALFETALMFLLGYQIGQAFGWPRTDSVYLGGIMMISSTAIITRILAEEGKSTERFAEVIYGILIAEDAIAILLIASLTGRGEATAELEWARLFPQFSRLTVFLVMLIVAGLLVVPRLLRFIARFYGDETLLVSVLALCFGTALLASELEFSVGLGSFLIGAIIAESEHIRRIERLTAPLRDMFSAVFFVAMGLLIDPHDLSQHAGPVVLITLAVVLGKLVSCTFGSFLTGCDRGVSLRVGLGLAQIGEFSFIIAALGASQGVTSPHLYPIAVCVSALTGALAPHLIRHSDRWVSLCEGLFPPRLIHFMDDYSGWARRFATQRRSTAVSRVVRLMLIQLGINLALVAGCFLTALFLHRQPWAWLDLLPAWAGGRTTTVWLLALLASLPVQIAFFRKLEALAMLLTEVTVGGHARARRRVVLGSLLSHTVQLGGMVLMGLVILSLSSPLLPTWRLLAVGLAIAALVTLVWRRSFVRLYARAQGSIHEVLRRENPEDAAPTNQLLPSLLEELQLLPVLLPADSPVVGRTIAESGLRSHTGATVVLVRRITDEFPNPSPHLQLQAGDRLFLLGRPAEVEAAREWLTR